MLTGLLLLYPTQFCFGEYVFVVAVLSVCHKGEHPNKRVYLLNNGIKYICVMS